jgi:KUP system potassium uptake protein
MSEGADGGTKRKSVTSMPASVTTTGQYVASDSPHAAASHRAAQARGWDLAKLGLGALGVVYGDIGTSPLYALKECVCEIKARAAGGALVCSPEDTFGVLPTQQNVLGILSLMFWSLIAVVVVKYLVFVLRADNNGEGGELALMALVVPSNEGDGDRPPPRHRGSRLLLVFMGLFGASLLYGDGMITPAVTVISAVEGLEVATHTFERWVVPITCGIIIGLFAVQKRGTAGIGAIFGPLMLGWFLCIGIAGVPWVLERPEVIWAFLPTHGVRFFLDNGFHGFLVLGSVVLVVTGGEALYADMGHFGRRAIRWAWFLVAFPGLTLNYLGQGAVLLQNPEAAKNPFYALVEGGPWLYPMVAVATIAGVIASQALISGAYSLTRQAIQLGYCPRMTIIHTSGKTEGQIYIPEINGILMVACVTLVLSFRSSTNLTHAYGLAVTGSMTITSILFFFAVRERWKWKLLPSAALLVFFLTFDLAFLFANAAKIPHGGWVPIVIALGGFSILTTWKRGRSILGERIYSQSLALTAFLADLEVTKPLRVPGTAIFMTSTRRGTPNVLLHHFKHNKVLHEQVIILTMATDDVPEVPRRDRIRYKEFGNGFWAVTAHYGFMETPNMREVIKLCRQAGIHMKENDTSFYLGRETLVDGKQPIMATWRRRLFSFLSRNSRAATDFFGIPPNRVVELGTQIEL